MQNIFGNKKTVFMLVFPGMLVFCFAVLLPIFISMYLGMTDYTGISKPTFIGFENYKALFLSDSTFWKSVMHSYALGILIVLLQNPLCLLLALLTDKIGGKTEKIIRVIMFIPCIISVVITSKLWVNIFNPTYGMLNKVLDALHLAALKQDWLGDPKIALYSVFFVIIWQGFGWGYLIFYSGIKGLPPQLYEAAKIDGASGFKLLTKITIPLLRPVIIVCVTLVMISSLKQMEAIYIMTDGGPGDVTQFVANYLYKSAFSSYEFGYGNAISTIFVFICLVTTVVLNKVLKKDVVEF